MFGKYTSQVKYQDDETIKNKKRKREKIKSYDDANNNRLFKTTHTHAHLIKQ